MDSLKLIINTFSEEEKASFKLFINRDKNIDNRKDFQLFTLLDKTAQPKAEQIQSKLYNERNNSAYSALRRRLFNHIMDFLSINNSKYNLDEEIHLDRLFNLSQHLFKQNEFDAAWKYLNKAIQTAEKSNHYIKLKDIYLEAFQWSHTLNDFDLKDILQKFKQVQNQCKDYEKTIVALSVVRSKLSNYKAGADRSYLNSIISMVLFTYQLQDKIMKRPELMYMLAKTVRECIAAENDFISYENFILEKFEDLKSQNAFNQHNHIYKIKLMQLIMDAKFRNKKHQEVIEYGGIFQNTITEFDQSYLQNFSSIYMDYMSSAYTYLGEQDKAIELIENTVKLDASTEANFKRRLSNLYYQNGQYENALNQLNEIKHSEDWLINKFGEYWTIHSYILKACILYELGEYKSADKVLTKTIKTFRKELTRHKLTNSFILLLKKVFEKPERIQSSTFDKTIESFRNCSIDDQKDQAIKFYSWVSSKKEEKSYKEVLNQSSQTTIDA